MPLHMPDILQIIIISSQTWENLLENTIYGGKLVVEWFKVELENTSAGGNRLGDGQQF